ncbi:MAG TPA: hypothetical protein VGF10_04735 [Gaiella sp.]|jgi:hypothetical protein
MSLMLKRWRSWISPAARRGRKAAETHAEWVAQQREQFADASTASRS